jgi:hypothetical protein
MGLRCGRTSRTSLTRSFLVFACLTKFTLVSYWACVYEFHRNESVVAYWRIGRLVMRLELAQLRSHYCPETATV